MKRETTKIARRMNKDEKGLTLLEYAAGAAFVLIIATAAFTVFGTSLDNLFDQMGTNLEAFRADVETNTDNTPLDAVD